MEKRKADVMKRMFLAGIVCVVDASTFWDAYNEATAQASAASGHSAADALQLRGTGLESEEGMRKPLSALLVNQLESSDTVILNKADLVSAEELEKVKALLKALCPTPRHITSTQGAVPLKTLLP